MLHSESRSAVCNNCIGTSTTRNPAPQRTRTRPAARARRWLWARRRCGQSSRLCRGSCHRHRGPHPFVSCMSAFGSPVRSIGQGRGCRPAGCGLARMRCNCSRFLRSPRGAVVAGAGVGVRARCAASRADECWPSSRKSAPPRPQLGGQPYIDDLPYPTCYRALTLSARGRLLT